MVRDLSFINDLPLSQQLALLNGPALKPPPGVTPNLAHPPNHNEVGYGVLISSAVICTLLVSLRLYSRMFYHRKFDLEDSKCVT
jgi:hypothetical protein